MTDYAAKFQGGDAVARYKRKLDNRFEISRHRLEHRLLSRYASGRVFDCTIGVGRFIGTLPRVASYTGLDISGEFVDYVNANFPGTHARQGDLTAGIPEPTDTYDCVICLRSLSAIGQIEAILQEMVRIAKPGGFVIADYGRKPTKTEIGGKTVAVDGENLDAALAGLPARLVERVACDALTTRIKRSARLFRLLNGSLGGLVPEAALSAADRLLAPLLWERQIVVLQKPSA
jgi:SAM-dependent methyltransferase